MKASQSPPHSMRGDSGGGPSPNPPTVQLDLLKSRLKIHSNRARPRRGLFPLCCRSVNEFCRAVEGIPEQFTLQNMQMLHKNKRPSKDMAAWEKKSLQLSHHPRKGDSTGGGVAKQGKTDGEWACRRRGEGGEGHDSGGNSGVSRRWCGSGKRGAKPATGRWPRELARHRAGIRAAQCPCEQSLT